MAILRRVRIRLTAPCNTDFGHVLTDGPKGSGTPIVYKFQLS
jgi:peptide methionine sulfoxide reductase MsrB